MQDKNFLTDLSDRLCQALPAHLQAIKKDIEKNFYIILQNTLNKLDLVTRQEFDIQTKVLARSRKKIDALEAQVKELEKMLEEK
jgi:BMFP domain-containing protein YqiC